MTTPSATAAPPREGEGGKSRGWRGAASARVGVSALCFAAAALVPFEDLLRGALTGLVSLVAVVLVRPLTRRIWPPLAAPIGVLLVAAAATGAFKLVVPAVHANSPVVRISAYVIFLALDVALYTLYARTKGMTKPVAERQGYAFLPDLLFSLGYSTFVVSRSIYSHAFSASRSPRSCSGPTCSQQ
jgi:hypothetical protein